MRAIVPIFRYSVNTKWYIYKVIHWVSDCRCIVNNLNFVENYKYFVEGMSYVDSNR